MKILNTFACEAGVQIVIEVTVKKQVIEDHIVPGNKNWAIWNARGTSLLDLCNIEKSYELIQVDVGVAMPLWGRFSQKFQYSYNQRNQD